MNCRHVQRRLSEYLDSALGAHETWELEKHLADCRGCARSLGALRRTVGAVRSAPRCEVTPDFADALQRRLALVTPKPARRAWLAGAASLFRPRILPAWGLGLAATALVVFAYPPHDLEVRAPVRPAIAASTSRELQAAQSESVALAATNPFEDVATANLAASMPAAEPTTSD